MKANRRMITFHHAKRAAAVLFLAAIIVASGCARSGVPPASDPETARGAVFTALTSWQKSESIDALANRRPPIYFSDPRCNADTKLTKFSVDEEPTMHGPTVRVTAQLSLTMKDGSTREKRTVYLVDTTPAIVIVPE